MRRALLPMLLVLAAGPAGAVDHNNLDAHRPLRFDDAETIALHEQALDAGLRFGWPRRRALGLGAEVEYLYGFALNSHLGIAFEPSIGGRPGSADTRFDPGRVSLGVQHNLRREYDASPALSLRLDAGLPTGRAEDRGAALRLRGIASRSVGRYDRLHLNADLNALVGGPPDQRASHPAVTLGWSRPLGYPRRFTRTLVAEAGARAGERRGTGPVLFAGIGLRQQVGARSVFDAGLEADVAGWNGAPRDRLRLILGYSYGF